MGDSVVWPVLVRHAYDGTVTVIYGDGREVPLLPGEVQAFSPKSRQLERRAVEMLDALGPGEWVPAP